MNWITKSFDALTTDELYSILRLRSEIFVVEQNCVYQDMDNKDQLAFHFFCIKNNTIIAYTRLFKPGDYYAEAAIGRVVVSKFERGYGLGHELIKHSIIKTKELFGKTPIKIGAQTYLKSFYESHGFKKISEEYLEDGIPHIHMLLKF